MPGWVNVDCRPLPGVDVVCDLEQIPWPWKDNSVDEILMSHCLEHLDDPMGAVKEISRILKPGGIVNVYLPNFSGSMVAAIGHKHPFSVVWCRQMSGEAGAEHNQNYDRLPLEMVRLKLNCIWYRCGLHPHWLARLVIRCLEGYFNRSPRYQDAWEIIGLCHPQEIHWTVRKI